MATSGSIDYTMDRQGVIKRMARLCNALAFDAEPSASLGDVCNTILNGYLKHLMVQGPHLWRQAEGVLFLRESAQYYDLGSTGDHATKLADFVSTTVDGAHTATDTTILVADDDGIADGDNIGIELADGTRQWTTVSGAPAANVVTLATGITGDVDDDATVYCYTSKVERPVRITDLRRRVSGVDTPVPLVSRQEYFEQSSKAASGKVTLAYYDRQLSLGRLYVWPVADDVDDTLRFTYERTVEDVDVNGDNLDVPVEALETICFGGAYRLAVELGRPLERIAFLKREAEQREAELLAFDQEDASVSFVPDLR